MRTSHTTTWEADYRPAHHPHLDKDLETEVAIVGGGLVGVMTAYPLAKEGRKVAVFEAKEVGTGATLATTAFLTSSIDTDATDLIPMFGVEKARGVRSSHQEAIELIEQIAREESIDCALERCSNWYFANKDGEQDSLEKEYDAMKRLGYDVALHGQIAAGFRNGGGIELRNQGKFNPIIFLQEVARRAEKLGVEFYEHTRVSEVGDGKLRVGPHTVTADWAIIATYDPLGNPWHTFMKKGMYTSYVLEVEIPSGIIMPGTYEDTDNPYHYFRVDAGEDKDRLIIGGEDHRHEIPLPARNNFAALREYVSDLLGDHPYTIVRQWSGPIMEPSDGLPLIGRISECTLVATAFSGNGMTYSAIAAQVFRDIIIGKRNAYEKLYRPTRIPRLRQLWRKGRDYMEELILGAGRNLFR